MPEGLKKEFQQGNYEEVLSLTIDSPDPQFDTDDYPYVIGSLALTGRNDEVESLFDQLLELPDAAPSTIFASRYFFGMSVCRERNFRRAREIFCKNFAELKQAGDSDKLSQFYAYFGLAFFRFSTGRYGRALQWASLAVKLATKSEDSFAAVLAFELLGHIQCCLGCVYKGLRNIDFALKKSKALGSGAIEHAVKASKLRYQAQFGLKPIADTVGALQASIEECKFEESYNAALLRISLAHQYIFRGQLGLANAQLDKAAKYVFQVDNPLLEIRYRICLAEILYQQGRLSQCLPLLKESAELARRKTHYDLLLACLGFQEKIVNELGINDRSQDRNKEIRHLTLLSSNGMAKRILDRLNLAKNGAGASQDKLGDLIDAVHQNHPETLAKVFDSGYYIFLKRLLGVEASSKTIFLGLQDKHITIFAEGEVFHNSVQYTNMSAQFLELLSQCSSLSKEEITVGVWGQTYNPLRHDNLIYNLVNRTRKMLGPYASWVMNDEKGYFLAAGIQVKNYLFKEQGSEDIVQENVTFDKPAAEPQGQAYDLTFRQAKMYKLLQEVGRIQTKDVVERFSVSEATASRDLSALYKKKLIERHGSGRATEYVVIH